MQTTRRKTLFVGVDVHKDTHTAVGLSPYGERVFEMTIGNDTPDFIPLIKNANSEAAEAGLVPFFGLEDVHSWGARLSAFLAMREMPVVAVAPVLVERLRHSATHPEKNDTLDAQGVAEVMIRKMDTLPSYTLSDESKMAKQLREISFEREGLVKERTRLKNQLHTLLHRIHNTGYRSKYKDPFCQKALRHWMRSIPKYADAVAVRRMKRAVRRVRDLDTEIRDVEKELSSLLEEGEYTLTTAPGCGVVVAAEMIGEIGDITRFKSPGALAKYAGCAPREISAGKTQTTRWRKTRSGGRRLNRAFHRMALSQISMSGNRAGRAYYERKISQGKTKAQALVCLRRQLVTQFSLHLPHSGSPISTEPLTMWE